MTDAYNELPTKHELAYHNWGLRMIAKIEQAAKQHGYDCSKDTRAGSRYLCLSKEFADGEHDAIDIRLADHKSRYGGCEFYLFFDDESIDDIIERLSEFDNEQPATNTD